jgi:hypothetical protein
LKVEKKLKTQGDPINGYVKLSMKQEKEGIDSESSINQYLMMGKGFR